MTLEKSMFLALVIGIWACICGFISGVIFKNPIAIFFAVVAAAAIGWQAICLTVLVVRVILEKR